MKTALITGAGGGLGHASIEQFRKGGWRVIPTDMKAGAWSEGEDAPLIGTIGSPEWTSELHTLAADGLDAVVSAHGIEGTGGLFDLDEARMSLVMTVNYSTVVKLHENTIDLLEKKGGAFVAISSQAGVQGETAAAAYCASKFAVREFMNLQVSHSNGKVRYRTLCPGATETPLLKKAFEGIAAAEGITYEEVLGRRSAAVPIGRLGRPTDIGAATLWLAELRTKAILGALVSGGEVLR